MTFQLNRLLNLSKRHKFVFAVLFLSGLYYVAEVYQSNTLSSVAVAIALSILTDILLFIILRRDISKTFYYPLFIIPFLYTLSFNLFNALVPARFVSRILLVSFYSFGLYSLYLSLNILAISSTRTINLLRSARGVSFVITLIVLFFFLNVLFALHFHMLITTLLVFITVFLLNLQSLWTYALDKNLFKEIANYSLFISLAVAELSFILTLWPVNSTVYSIFLTGMFYAYSGLSHAWIEKRLFKGVFWEYLWVGFIVILLLLRFAEWKI